MEQRGFSGIWIVLHPLSLAYLPWYGFDPIPLGLCIIPDATLSGKGIASDRPGPGFKEDKRRSCCAEKTGYILLPQKSRQPVFGLKMLAVWAGDMPPAENVAWNPTNAALNLPTYTIDPKISSSSKACQLHQPNG